MSAYILSSSTPLNSFMNGAILKRRDCVEHEASELSAGCFVVCGKTALSREPI